MASAQQGKPGEIEIVWTDSQFPQKWRCERWLVENRTLAFVVDGKMIVIPYENIRHYTFTPDPDTD